MRSRAIGSVLLGAFVVWLGAPLASVAATPAVELVDVGLKRQVRVAAGPLTVRVSSAQGAAFTGDVQVRTRPVKRPFEEQLTPRFSDARGVSLAAGSEAIVCVDLPERDAWASDGFDLLLHDRSGALVTTRHVPQKEAAASSLSETSIGILTGDIAALKQVQDQILFSPRQDAKEIFEQPSAKFLFLGADTTSCWSAYTGLALLVVAMPEAEIGEPLREAIRTAVLKGLRLAIHDPSGQPDRLFGPYATRGSEARPVGHGTIFRIARLDDPNEWTAVRDAIFPRRHSGMPEAPVLDRRPAADLGAVDGERWLASRYQRPRLPGARALLVSFVAYVMLLGPVSFVILKRRDARDLGWLSTPAIAAAFSVILAVWVYEHQFHESELDVGVVRETVGAEPDVDTSMTARLAWPRDRLHDVRLALDWRGLEHGQLDPDRPDRRSAQERARWRWEPGSLSVAGVRTPRWSAIDLTARGFVEGHAPVKLSGGAVENLLAVPFQEALFLDRDGFVETTALAPGARWSLGAASARQDARLFVRGAGWRGDDPPSLALRDVIFFGGLGELKGALERVDGIFVGWTAEPGPAVEIDTAAQVRKTWTVYIHAFVKEGA